MKEKEQLTRIQQKRGLENEMDDLPNWADVPFTLSASVHNCLARGSCGWPARELPGSVPISNLEQPGRGREVKFEPSGKATPDDA
jgi:hypothetical protein